MSLETVVEDIREEARARAAEIHEEADRQAEVMIEEAEADAEETIESAEREVEAQIERERERAHSSATLEAKQQRLAARRDLLEEVYATVESAIADMTGDRREELTRTLIEYGLTEFADDATVRVSGREADQELIEAILEDYERAHFGEPRACLGGVVLESDTARVRVNNTFDSILEDVWEDELRNISERLFEQ